MLILGPTFCVHNFFLLAMIASFLLFICPLYALQRHGVSHTCFPKNPEANTWISAMDMLVDSHEHYPYYHSMG